VLSSALLSGVDWYVPLFWHPGSVPLAAWMSGFCCPRGILAAAGGFRLCTNGCRFRTGSSARDWFSRFARVRKQDRCSTRIQDICDTEVSYKSISILDLFIGW